MIIQFDTLTLTDEDLKLIRSILDGKPEAPAPTSAPAAALAEARAAVQERKPRTPKAKPEPEPEEEEEDLVGGGPTLDDALAKASELIAAGKHAVVKKALADCGVKRVSELSPGSITKFLGAL